MSSVEKPDAPVNGGQWMSHKEINEIYGGLQFAMGQVSALRSEITSHENRARELYRLLDGLRRTAKPLKQPQRQQVL